MGLTGVSFWANYQAMDSYLRSWRERRGWSLRDLDERSGVSYVTIQKIEAGVVNPTVATLKKIARALRIPIRDLFPAERRPNKTRRGRR